MTHHQTHLPATFDPNAPAEGDGIFGLPFSENEARCVLIPVPWEATTSYGGGTADGPKAILAASAQLDLFDAEVEHPYLPGIHMLPENPEIQEWNEKARTAAKLWRHEYKDRAALAQVNDLSARLNEWVYQQTLSRLERGKTVGIIGGDHSTPFGAIRAAAERHPGLGILHVDAHLDLRDAYQEFQWSHASIMHNVLEKVPQVKRLVQVGIRDFCQQEAEFAASQNRRVEIYYDAVLQRAKLQGQTWATQVERIISSLPKEVWISFDIDGLDPQLCPNTGTPVPGGLSFSEATYLISEVARSGRSIVGFDLNEVAPAPSESGWNPEWDANVGMRLLYKLIAWTFVSQGLCKAREIQESS